MAATLFVIKGKDQGHRFELSKSETTLGRDASNDIQLNDEEVSRRHAHIVQINGRFALADLGSANGTYVNAQPIRGKRSLRTGDHLHVGATTMIFTAVTKRPAEDLSDIVRLVPNDESQSGSRILKTMSQDESSEILSPSSSAESPWLRRARSNLQIMYRTALAVSHTLDIDQLLHRIMELIFEWVDADRGCVMLIDQETKELEPKVSRRRESEDEEEQILISNTILDFVMQNSEGVLTSDATDDKRWDPAGSIVRTGVREAVCVPMQGRYGIVGVIYIDTFTPPGRVIQQGGATRFGEEHLKLMVAIGHQAALAVEDTSYYSAMVQAERLAAMGQTIATLSHHVKNILQGIRGGSYLIEEGLKGQEFDVVRKGWRIVDKNQEKISNLVMDMLTFSKEREPDLTVGNLNQVVADVMELMAGRAETENIELHFEPNEALPEFTFDQEGIHRAVLNVVGNGMDACRKTENARMVLETVYDSKEEIAVIRVTDNGAGIPEEEVDKIFSMFESNKGHRGTGLGLPVSQKILREHGGDILVESTLGVGSTFSMRLPAKGRESASMSETIQFDV